MRVRMLTNCSLLHYRHLKTLLLVTYNNKTGAEHNDLFPWEIMRSSGASPIRAFGQLAKNSFLDERNDACITTPSSRGDR